MDMNYGVQWARRVIAGTPARPGAIPWQERAEAFANLAAAYQILADQAQADGDIDSLLTYGEMVDHYQWLSDQWYREGDLP